MAYILYPSMIVNFYLKNDLLKDYLKSIFFYENGIYHVTRVHDFGRLLSSLISYSDKPILKTKENIQFLLPESPGNRTAKNKFIYIKQEDQLKLIDALNAVFNIDFDRYYLAGRKIGLQQKDIIQAFIVSRKLTALIGNIEVLKKRQYREEIILLEKRKQELLKKAQYRNEAVENSLKEYKQLYIN